MSLKAKIEAVIYASEEPVTLAQLTGLLGEEGQAELDSLASQQQSLALEDEESDDAAAIEPIEDADALNAETIVPSEIVEQTSAPVIPSESSESKDPDSSSPAEVSEPLSNDETPTPAANAKSDAKSLAADQKLAARKLRDYFRSLLDELIADYANGDRGLEIREVAGGFRLGTKAEYHDAVRGFVKSLKPPLKLTLQALETLAVVAYKQPVTAPEVSEIRGVDSAGVLGSLLTRKLVTTAGRKQVIGRPILYKTTKDFLLRFGLKDINELPSIEEFEKMAGERNDAVQEEIPMEANTTHASEEASADLTVDGPATDSDSPALSSEARAGADPDAPTSEPESIPEAETPAELEPSADIHTPQADGDPEDEPPAVLNESAADEDESPAE